MRKIILITFAFCFQVLFCIAQNLPIGYLDYVDQNGGYGWAYDQDAGTLPVDVHIYIDGRLYAAITANESRPDLVTAGITPNPEHGYSFTITGYDPTRAHEVIVYAINYGGGVNPSLTNCPAIIGVQPSGDASISNIAGPSSIVISTTQRLAGAIGSLTWNGKEFINSYDHGRELQSATSFNGWGECFNPTEAGSSQDGTGNISTSFLQYLNASGNFLETQILPAFWTQPGYTAPGCGAAINTTQRASHYFHKKVSIGMPGMAHVVKYNTEFDIPENYSSGTFEALTGYMPPDFSVFWTYNPASQQLTSLSDGPGEQELPIVFSTTDNNYAMGIYSPDLPDPQWAGAGYGRFRFGDCTKWNCVFRENNVTGTYKFRSYLFVGSLTNVTVSMTQLYNYFNIAANFSADTVYAGSTTNFTDFTTGSNSETQYQWDINNDGTIEDTTSGNFSYLFPAAGNYSVKLTTINGVASAHQSSIIKNVVVLYNGIPPAVQPVSPVSPVCEGSGVSFSISVTGDAPFIYQWQLNGVDIAGANTDIYSLASAQLTDAGNYTCVVTNAYGSDVSDSIALVVNSVPIVTVVGTNIACNGLCDGIATLSASGGTAPYSYMWSIGAISNPISGLCAGIYCCTITDANGCTATICVTITEPDAIVVTISQTNVMINGQCTGIAIASAVGGIAPPYSYLWSNGAYGDTITDLCADVVYSVTVADVNLCTATNSVTITQPNELIISTSQTNVSCNGLCDGTVIITLSGGVPAYLYTWSPVGTNPSAMCAGTYGLTVTDSNGATATASITITEPEALSVSVSQTNVTCFGNYDGTATVSVTGGSPPYFYQWNTGAIGISITNLCVGVYCCTIVDANGCTITSCVTITQPNELIVTATQTTSITCNGNCDASVTIIANGGTPPYTYLWSTGGDWWWDLCAGIYYCTVTDANGCIAIIPVVVSEPLPITDTISSTDDNGTGNGTATINVLGGTPSYTYLWDDSLAQTTATATGLYTGLYHVTVTDANGCTIVDSVYVIITGISLEIINNSFNLFPNPANTLINLNISTNISEEITIIIYNNIGDVVLRKDILLSSGNNSHTFDVMQFTSGLYFVKLQKNNDISYIKFIKKQ